MSEEHQKIVHVHLPPDSGFKNTLTAGDHSITSDEPETVDGGTDAGPDPYDLLLMSLGSCTVMTLKMYAERKGWPIEDVYVELRHSKKHASDCSECEQPSSKLDHIEKELIIKGDLDEKQIKRLVNISKKCPVHRTLQSEIQIDTSVSRS